MPKVCTPFAGWSSNPAPRSRWFVPRRPRRRVCQRAATRIRCPSSARDRSMATTSSSPSRSGWPVLRLDTSHSSNSAHGALAHEARGHGTGLVESKSLPRSNVRRGHWRRSPTSLNSNPAFRRPDERGGLHEPGLVPYGRRCTCSPHTYSRTAFTCRWRAHGIRSDSPTSFGGGEHQLHTVRST